MLSKVEITRKRVILIRDASRIYFSRRDKKDPKVAEERRQAAEDIRFFHNKWLAAKQ